MLLTTLHRFVKDAPAPVPVAVYSLVDGHRVPCTHATLFWTGLAGREVWMRLVEPGPGGVDNVTEFVVDSSVAEQLSYAHGELSYHGAVPARLPAAPVRQQVLVLPSVRVPLPDRPPPPDWLRGVATT